MRKGYWKALLRRLRSRVASGYKVFTPSFGAHQSLTLIEVLGSGDESLDVPAELALAATAEGATFFLDTDNNLVTLRTDGAPASVSTGLDLAGFVDALEAGDGATAVDGDDLDFLAWQAQRRKPLLSD